MSVSLNLQVYVGVI